MDVLASAHRPSQPTSPQRGFSKDGVEDHINMIFNKLGASNRTEAVAIALRKHLLKI